MLAGKDTDTYFCTYSIIIYGISFGISTISLFLHPELIENNNSVNNKICQREHFSRREGSVKTSTASGKE